MHRVSHTRPAPSEFPQGRKAARVGGRSGAMYQAYPFLFLPPNHPNSVAPVHNRENSTTLIGRSTLSRRSCAGGEVSGTAAAAHDEDTCKDHHSRKDFLPGKGFHSKTDTDDSGDDRLGVAVHTHEGRSEAFLPERNQEVCHTGCA